MSHREWVHIWYSLQLLYFMPVRYYTYHKRGYHYFLADLCYFVNVLLLLSIWVFPNSRRLMIATYCLAYGNNAWAIAMWRNSLVFHSLDKVTSLFIHIMPPVVLHCLVHCVDPVIIEAKFPAISRVKNIEHYGLREMIIWATIPYGIWQISYHLLITVSPIPNPPPTINTSIDIFQRFGDAIKLPLVVQHLLLGSEKVTPRLGSENLSCGSQQIFKSLHSCSFNTHMRL